MRGPLREGRPRQLGRRCLFQMETRHAAPLFELSIFSRSTEGECSRAAWQRIPSVVRVLRAPGHVVMGHGAGVQRGVLVPEGVDPVLAQVLQILPALLRGIPNTL